MPTVAEQLREAREAKQLTVEQVAEVTKVRTDHLRALEEGNFNVFSAPIYIRGSVKIYAAALKMDCAQVLATLDAELKGTQKFSEPPPLTEQRKTVLDHLTLWLAKLNWKVGFAGLAIIAGVVVVSLLVFALWHHHKSDPIKNLTPAVYRPVNSGDTLPLPRR